MMVSSLVAHAQWFHNDWNYRVAISINNAVINQTGKVNIDFSALGLTGSLDEASVRIAKEDGTLLVQQEFTDILYNNADDILDNDRGEVKFIIEDAGSVTYYIYYDNIANGAKTALASNYALNGNFEHSTGTTPTGWIIGTANLGANQPNNEVHSEANENSTVSVVDTGGTNQTRTVNNTARTGDAFHLHGFRTNRENSNTREQTWIEKSFSVPTTNSGSFVYWFRIQGWDQATGDTDYDRFRVYVNGTIINPTSLAISNNSVAIFSAVYGKQSAYSQYGDLGWTQATLNLAAYAGTSITVRLEQVTANDDGWKSWQLIDDVEWSLNTAITFGTQEEQPKVNLSLIKSSCVISDPFNGTTNPKRISGATIRYALEVQNIGSQTAENVILTDTLSSLFASSTISNLQIQSGICNCLNVVSSSNNGINGSANGVNPIELDFGTVLGTNDPITPVIECAYFEVDLL